MNLYAESSAILAWLLGEDDGKSVRRILASAKIVICSDLTLVECERVLIRAVALGDIKEAIAAGLRSHLNTAATTWNVLRLAPEIIERARQPFPAEPIRTLDALHIASALYARQVVPDLDILSLDDRIRRAGHALGFNLQPE